MERTRTGWTVAVASMVALIAGSTGIAFYTQGLFLGPMTRTFGWSRNAYFSAVLVSGLASALATPLIGRLIDRFGVRRVLVPGVLLFALFNALLGFVGPSFLAYVVLTALVGVAGVVQGPLPYVKAVSSWFDGRRGLALAVALSGTGLGGVLVPPFTAWLLTTVGWRGARIGLALAVLVVALPSVLIAVREAPTAGASPDRARAGDAEAAGLSAGEALATPTLWLLVGAFFLSGLVVNGVVANLVPMLTRKGLSLSAAAGALSMLAAAQVGGRFLSGLILDRVQSARVALIWFACGAAGALLLRASGGSGLLPWGAMLIGLALGAELELSGVFISRFFGLRRFGLLYGLVFAAYLIGATAGPLAASALAGGASGYDGALLAAVAALAVAGALMLAVGPYRFLPGARGAAMASD